MVINYQKFPVLEMLQPKKNDKGEWIKELIYINEFEKHGYHRQAKILQA